MALDRVPGDFNIYIGGYISLRRKEALTRANITHVLSVVDWLIDEELIKRFKHLSIEVNDVDDEKLIDHFAVANRFIEQGLRDGGGVLVHCAMGKSRSATICIAYLLWKSPRRGSANALDPAAALVLLRQSRPLCEPNEGFMEQLELYHEMGCPDNVGNDPRYQRWLYKQALQESLSIGRAPEMADIRFEDEYTPSTIATESGKAAHGMTLRCRKCRQVLADARFLVDHNPLSPSGPCAHIYVQPLSWMRSSLQGGVLEGRLSCPNAKCKTNIGKFAWQGLKCSCGQWMTPAFSLIRGKVDEIVPARSDTKIRQPPGTGILGNL